MALQTPPSGLSSTQIQFQGQKQTDKQVSQTGHCRSARKVFAVGRLEKKFKKSSRVTSKSSEQLKHISFFFFFFYLSSVSERETWLRETDMLLFAITFFFFFLPP